MASLRNRQRLALLLTLGLFAAAAGVSWVGVRAAWIPVRVPTGEQARRMAGSDVRLPYDDIELPLGPHAQTFQTACVICHSPRLALNQPALSREKWTEVVHKMVATYGAPIIPADERQIVEYLVAVQAGRGDR
jgi:hypothetical protein